MQYPEKLLRVGGLEIRPDRRQATLDGHALRLRPKTFDLLVYLARHPDRVVSKQELFDNLWENTQVSANSLAQCVIELRKALGDDLREPRFIETVAKAGYRFIGEVEETAAPPEPIQRTRWWIWAAAAAAGIAAVAYLPAFTRLLTPTTLPAKRGEVAWWKFDEGAGTLTHDGIGGRQATLSAQVSRVTGVSGGALRMGGTETPLRGRDPGGMPRGGEPRTLVAWIKTDSTNADSTAIFQYGSATPHTGADGFYLMLQESGRAAFGNYYEAILSRERVDDGRWHQIAGVFEGVATGKARLYVDGILQGEGAIRKSLNRGDTSDWTIGGGTWGGTSFRGAVDDIRVYDRALRPADVQGLYRCVSGAVDLKIDGRDPYYFVPVHGPSIEIAPSGLKNSARDFAGVTFVKAGGDCAHGSIVAGDIGQDVTIEAELRVPRGPAGEVTEAGPFFRSRRASPGDGAIGGTSAGYWAQLLSTGQVRVKRLHPVAIVAFSATPEQFDANSFHKLSAAAKGETLEVNLDGAPVHFDEGGKARRTVRIPAAWETAAPPGQNRGSAGIAFGSEAFRDRVGGQEARNITVRVR